MHFRVQESRAFADLLFSGGRYLLRLATRKISSTFASVIAFFPHAHPVGLICFILFQILRYLKMQERGSR